MSENKQELGYQDIKNYQDVKHQYQELAYNEAARLGITSGERDGQIDAFRHAYISALVTFREGETRAFILGEGNEVVGTILYGQKSPARLMDGQPLPNSFRTHYAPPFNIRRILCQNPD